MTQLSPEARRLLQLARSHDEPSPAALRRAEHSLAIRIARGVGVTAVSALWAQSASGFALGTSKLVVIAALAGATTAVGYWAMPQLAAVSTVSRSSSTAAPRAERQTRSATLASNPGPESRTEEPTPLAPPVTATVNRPAPRTSASTARAEHNATPSADRLREETQELRLAQQALRAGNTGVALELLSQQDQTFRDGVLQQERSAARVLALCESGQRDLARAEAQRFEQRWPKSPLVARLRSACL